MFAILHPPPPLLNPKHWQVVLKASRNASNAAILIIFKRRITQLFIFFSIISKKKTKLFPFTTYVGIKNTCLQPNILQLSATDCFAFPLVTLTFNIIAW